MAQKDEIAMKKNTEKQKKHVMDGEKDGESKPGKKKNHPKAAHLKNSDGEMEGERRKKRGEKGTDVSGDEGKPGEKRARRESGDEKGQHAEESQLIKKSRGQDNSKQDVGVCCVSCSSTVDITGGDMNNKQGTHRRERDEVDKCSLVQNLSVDREPDRKSREERDKRDESSDGDRYVSWVQCSKPECGKWRRLSDGVDPSVLPDDWTCQNSTDPTFSSCSAPEEKSSAPEEEMFFCSLVPGSLVWARQSGYPWWPAMVEQDPNTGDFLEFRKETDLTPYKCHVTYFGEPVTRAWITCSRVKDYTDLSENQLLTDVVKGLKDSIYMAKEALTLSLKERLMKFAFHSRYVSDRESSEDSDIAEMLELLCGKVENDCSNEDLGSKKWRSAGKKQKGRKRTGKERDKTHGEGEKKKRVKKKLKEGKDGKEKKCLTPSFSLPKEKKQHKTDTADQTVPQSTVTTCIDMTFDLDIHSEEEEVERKRERGKHGTDGKERKAGEWREDEDEGDEEHKDVPDHVEEQDRFSLMLLGEE